MQLTASANAHAERWVRSIKEECLTKLILFGEHSLRRVVSNFLEHYHQERNHQGNDNQLLFPAPENTSAGCNPLPRAPRRLIEILRARRMNFSPYGLKSRPSDG